MVRLSKYKRRIIEINHNFTDFSEAGDSISQEIIGRIVNYGSISFNGRYGEGNLAGNVVTVITQHGSYWIECDPLSYPDLCVFADSYHDRQGYSPKLEFEIKKRWFRPLSALWTLVNFRILEYDPPSFLKLEPPKPIKAKENIKESIFADGFSWDKVFLNSQEPEYTLTDQIEEYLYSGGALSKSKIRQHFSIGTDTVDIIFEELVDRGIIAPPKKNGLPYTLLTAD